MCHVWTCVCLQSSVHQKRKLLRGKGVVAVCMLAPFHLAPSLLFLLLLGFPLRSCARLYINHIIQYQVGEEESRMDWTTGEITPNKHWHKEACMYYNVNGILTTALLLRLVQQYTNTRLLPLLFSARLLLGSFLSIVRHFYGHRLPAPKPAYTYVSVRAHKGIGL